MAIKIALSGKFGSGKSLAVQYLMELFGGEEVKFADPLYELMHTIQDFVGFQKEKDGKLLQWIGTEYGRSKDPDVWVKMFKSRLLTKQGNIFISDLRFPNELQACKELGIKTVRLIRDVDSRKDNQGNRDPDHPSETALDGRSDFDLIIHNDGTVRELQEKLLDFVKYGT